jgi:hypothetical protein
MCNRRAAVSHSSRRRGCRVVLIDPFALSVIEKLRQFLVNPALRPSISRRKLVAAWTM